jgi:patatin-like phospholipase/acyl hydrolase
MGKKNMRIVSLDAGGIKGLYSALMINGIEDIYKVNFNLNFDYFIGTSIGAVIAAALADGVKSKSILDKFIDFKNEIHKGHLHLAGKLFNWIDYLFGEKKLASIKPKLFIPLYNISHKQHSYISNYSEFDDIKISDILKAACSDIRIMKPHVFTETNLLFADAGFFAYDPIIFFLRNNPALLNSQISIISIGSGLITNALNDLNKSDVFDTFYDSFLQEQFMTTKFFFDTKKEVNYLRISEFFSKTPDNFSLDDMTNLAKKRLLSLNNNDFAKVKFT